MGTAGSFVRPYNGTAYPKGICSAALHCGTPSPTDVYLRRTGSDDGRAEKIPPSFQCTAASILYGLGKMCRLDVLAALQVGNGPGHTQYAVVAAGR